MEYIQNLFLKIFSVIFPYIQEVFITYLIILCIAIVIAYLLFNTIKKISTKSTPEMLLKWLLIICEAMLIAFILWFIIEHFHTYKLWEVSLRFNGKNI